MAMRRITRGTGLLAAGALLLVAACGGGGGGGGNGSQGPNLTVSTTSVEKSADAGTPSRPEASFEITVSDAPASGVSIGGNFSQNGIDNVTLNATSQSKGVVTIFFKDPSIVGPGDYQDRVQLGICRNDSCSAIRDGTLRTVDVAYTVTGTPPSISVATNVVERVAPPYTIDVAVENIPVTLQGIDPTDVNFDTQSSGRGLQYASVIPDGGGGLVLQLAFQPPSELGFGTFEAAVTVNACAVVSCPAGLHGSPFVVTTRFEVNSTVDGANGYTIREVSLRAADLVWDADRGTIYAATSASDAAHPDSIVALDPVSGSVGAAAFAGSNPSTLAMSGDGQFLYVGLWESDAIRRFLLPGFEPDIEVPLSASANEVWGDIQVVPDRSNSIVVTRSSFATAGYEIAVYDDAVRRPDVVQDTVSTIRSTQFGATPDVLYGGGDLISTMTVSSDGLDLLSAVVFDTGFIPGRIHYDAGVLYSDRANAIEPVSGTVLGSYPMGVGEFGLGVAPESSNDRIFVVGHGIKGFFLRSYALATFSPIAEVPLHSLQINANRAVRIIRWGRDGLAFPTDDGRVILVTGPFVKP